MENLGRATSLSDKAMQLMHEHEIPPPPSNFLVWYECCRGSEPQLKKALDILLSNHAHFTPERNEEIYTRFFVASDEVAEVVNAGAALERQIGKVRQSVEQASQDQGEYGSKLAGYSDDLGAMGPEQVKGLVGEMLQETESVVEKSRVLEQDLATATQEIEELRTSLSLVRAEALTDGLTGLANRKYFDQRLRDEAAQAMESGADLTLFLLDIGHFKAFNDTYGHTVGDSVLKVVARTMKDGVKGQDPAARYGGEEFAVILPNTKLEAAAVVAEQLRVRMAGAELKDTKSGKSFGSVTFSIGVAQYRLGEPLGDLVDRADTGLYRAKEKGRNRVVTEADIAEEPLAAAG